MRALLALVSLAGCTPEGAVQPTGPLPHDPTGTGQPPPMSQGPGPALTLPTWPQATTTTPVTTLSPTELCFEDIASVDPLLPNPDYDQYGPVVGSHCSGTNHQDILDVERVVFLGDSVTVGTPPTGSGQFYRTQLADELVTRFGLDAPGFQWNNVAVLDGTTMQMQSGDFWSCAEWGARADDLQRDGTQLADCFPPETRDQRTLVIATVGGNDLASLQQGFQDGLPEEDLWAQTEEFMGLMRDAVDYLTDPVEFPAGNYVILTNLYEYTDGTGEVTSCPGAALAGYEDTTDPALQQMVVWAMEQFMSISVDDQTDLLFLLENFCGHGYNRDDPNGRCYRGPDAELWFDLTCIHPNPKGHDVITDMFLDVIDE